MENNLRNEISAGLISANMNVGSRIPFSQSVLLNTIELGLFRSSRHRPHLAGGKFRHHKKSETPNAWPSLKFVNPDPNALEADSRESMRDGHLQWTRGPALDCLHCVIASIPKQGTHMCLRT